MVAVRQHQVFAKWFRKLSDRQAQARILVRIGRIEEGNLGDHKGVGGGVSELRLTYGPGYRIYYTMRGNTMIILLCGGDKDSQDDDIAMARGLVTELDNEQDDPV
jgi:putative addiction module killer protein